jgi:hypothetical protein
MLAESMASLRSQIDFLLAEGHFPLVCQFIPHSTHWRIVVLGGSAAASYRNKAVEGDFRTCGSTEKSDFEASPPDEAVEMAIRATAACGLEFAGVDVLEDREGRCWFLEANCPCYFPHAQIYGGVDVAGAMVDFLVDKSSRLARKPRYAGSAVGSITLPLQRIGDAPSLFTIDGFISTDDCRHILAVADRSELLGGRASEIHRGVAGLSFEMPINGDAVLERIREEIHRAVGFDNDLGYTFRYRRYSAGDSHPPHLDDYSMAGRSLIATAIIYLTDSSGGETRFPHAVPAPIRIAPAAGRLAVWRTRRADGSIDDAALHESVPVIAGTKATITYFFYKKAAETACATL